MAEFAAVVAAVLFFLIAAFQVALAVGAPWGGYAYGGARIGKLPSSVRLGSAVAAVFLLLAASVVLAMGGVVDVTPVPEGGLKTVTWVLAGLMALNTVGNLAAKTKLERFGFGSATALLVVLLAFVAANGDGMA